MTIFKMKNNFNSKSNVPILTKRWYIVQVQGQTMSKLYASPFNNIKGVKMTLKIFQKRLRALKNRRFGEKPSYFQNRKS